jgi:sugar/nucleoside kinase (ribokinase family)
MISDSNSNNGTSFIEASRLVHVVSPNHDEWKSLLPQSHHPEPKPIPLDHIKDLGESLLQHTHSILGVILRCGEYGCLVGERRSTSSLKHVPPFHTSASKILDVTGAGNAFLGGVMVGLYQSGNDLVEASFYGSVSSSFTVEAIGPPNLSLGESEEEIWNGDVSHSTPIERLKIMRDAYTRSESGCTI